jgi:hypothetical protein
VFLNIIRLPLHSSPKLTFDGWFAPASTRRIGEA